MDQPDEFCPPHASEAVAEKKRAEQKRAEQANRKRKMAPPTSVRPPTKVSKVGRSMAGGSTSIKARVVPPPSRPDLFSPSPTKSESAHSVSATSSSESETESPGPPRKQQYARPPEAKKSAAAARVSYSRGRGTKRVSHYDAMKGGRRDRSQDESTDDSHNESSALSDQSPVRAAAPTVKEKFLNRLKTATASSLMPLGNRITAPNTERAATLGRAGPTNKSGHKSDDSTPPKTMVQKPVTGLPSKLASTVQRPPRPSLPAIAATRPKESNFCPSNSVKKLTAMKKEKVAAENLQPIDKNATSKELPDIQPLQQPPPPPSKSLVPSENMQSIGNTSLKDEKKAKTSLLPASQPPSKSQVTQEKMQNKQKSLFDIDDEENSSTVNDSNPALSETERPNKKTIDTPSVVGERQIAASSESPSDEQYAQTIQDTKDVCQDASQSADVLQGDLSLTSSDESDAEDDKVQEKISTPKSLLEKKDASAEPVVASATSASDVHNKPLSEIKKPESYLEQRFRSFNTGFTQRELTVVKRRKESTSKKWVNASSEADTDNPEEGNKRGPVSCQNEARASVQIQLGRLWRQNSRDDLENIAGQFLTKKAIECDFKRFLVQYGYVAVRDEKGWEAVTEVAEYAPLLTAKQSKLLSLVIMLVEAESPEMRDEYKSLADDFMAFILYRLFPEECFFNYKQCQLANICRFYMALVRYQGNEEAAKSFLFDVFYHKGNRNFVMLTVFFDVWPEIMFWTGTSASILNPLLETVIWAIYNTGPPNSLTELKVFETRHKVEKFCGLPQPKGMSADNLVKYLIEATEKDFDNEEWTDATKLSMLLLARVRDYSWTHNNVVRRLLVLLQKYMAIPEEGTTNSKMLGWVIDTVGLVSRVYPVEPARRNLKDIFSSFAQMLQSGGDIMTPELENACLRALIHTGHHLPVQVTKFLNEWRGPQFQQSPKTIRLVENFVGTKAYTQSTMTVQVTKKQKVFDQLNNRTA